MTAAAVPPLMRSAALPPTHRPGARPGARTRADVADVPYHLLVIGRYDASGLRTNSTVRKALDAIARDGGLLPSRGAERLCTPSHPASPQLAGPCGSPCGRGRSPRNRPCRDS